jgi:hypothetical protein
MSFHARTATLSGIGAGRGRAEDLRRELARWIAAGDERDTRVRAGSAGVTVELLERGRLRARGFGRDDLEALANALFGRQHDTRTPPRLSGTFRKKHVDGD